MLGPATGSIAEDREQIGSSFSAEEISPANQRTFNEPESFGPIGKGGEMKQRRAGIPFHEWEVGLLQSDRELAVELLRAAMESLDNPEERGGSLLSLRAVAE